MHVLDLGVWEFLVDLAMVALAGHEASPPGRQLSERASRRLQQVRLAGLGARAQPRTRRRF